MMSGLAPKNAGFQRTISAYLPTSREPTYWSIPNVIAGLIVYLAIYLLARKLSLSLPASSGRGPTWSFNLDAHCHVRVITSDGRPIACESDDIIEKAPISWRTSSAPIVSGRILDSANAKSSGIFLSRWWHTQSMSRCSSSVLTVNGIVGFVDAGKTFG